MIDSDPSTERLLARIRQLEEALRELVRGVDRAAAHGRDSYYWPDHVGPYVDGAHDKARAALNPDPPEQ